MSDQGRAMHKHPLAHTFKVNVQLPPDASEGNTGSYRADTSTDG